MMAVSSLRDVLKLLPMFMAAFWLAIMPAYDGRNPPTFTPQTLITADDGAAIDVADRIDMLNGDIVIAGLFMAVLPTSYDDAALILAGGIGELAKWAAKYPKLARHFEKTLDKLNATKGGVKPVNPEVNIASDQRTQHILHGDSTGGGHLWPGQPGKTAFPQDWDADKVMETISDIATDPNLSWIPQTGNGGMYTNAGNPARFVVTDANGNLPVVDGVPVKVVIEPAGEGIITGFPQY